MVVSVKSTVPFVAHPRLDQVSMNSEGKVELHAYLSVIVGKNYDVTINGELAIAV